MLNGPVASRNASYQLGTNLPAAGLSAASDCRARLLGGLTRMTRLLTVDDVADGLGVTKDWVYRCMPMVL